MKIQWRSLNRSILKSHSFWINVSTVVQHHSRRFGRSVATSLQWNGESVYISKTWGLEVEININMMKIPIDIKIEETLGADRELYQWYGSTTPDCFSHISTMTAAYKSPIKRQLCWFFKIPEVFFQEHFVNRQYMMVWHLPYDSLRWRMIPSIYKDKDRGSKKSRALFYVLSTLFFSIFSILCLRNLTAKQARLGNCLLNIMTHVCVLVQLSCVFFLNKFILTKEGLMLCGGNIPRLRLCIFLLISLCVSWCVFVYVYLFVFFSTYFVFKCISCGAVCG